MFLQKHHFQYLIHESLQRFQNRIGTDVKKKFPVAAIKTLYEILAPLVERVCLVEDAELAVALEAEGGQLFDSCLVGQLHVDVADANLLALPAVFDSVHHHYVAVECMVGVG